MAKTKSITSQFSTNDLYEIAYLIETRIVGLEKEIGGNPYADNTNAISLLWELIQMAKKTRIQIEDTGFTPQFNR